MEENTKVVIFKLGEEQYGLELELIDTIERMQPLTKVPRTPAFVKGVANFRGTIVPVIHLAGRFGLDEQPETDATRIIILTMKEMKVGLIVDSANDVIDLDGASMTEPPELVGGVKAKYLRSVAKLKDERLLILLNLKEVLNKDEIVQLQEMDTHAE